MEDNRRKFDFEGKNFYISSPTAEDIKNADWAYSKTYTKSLKDNMFTTAEMIDNLTRRGIVGPEYEQRKDELEGILSQKIMSLAGAITNKEKSNLALEIAKAREELFKWNQRVSGPMSNTCEQLADDARLEFLTSRLIESEDGTKLWSTYEDFIKEKNQAFALACRFQVMMFLYGMQPDFLENTPEAVAMREIEQDVASLTKQEALMKTIDTSEEEEVDFEDIEDKKVEEITNIVDQPPTKRKRGSKKPKE